MKKIIIPIIVGLCVAVFCAIIKLPEFQSGCMAMNGYWITREILIAKLWAK